MDFEIRHIRRDERHLLEDFLYEAIFVPEDFEGELPRFVIYDDPKCRAAFEGYGALPYDRAVVVAIDGAVVGACWVRTTDEYGHIDGATPSFSISLYRPYRGQGIGAAMMHAILVELRDAGYAPAEQFYRNRGYQDVSEDVWEIESEGALPAATLTYKIMEKRLG